MIHETNKDLTSFNTFGIKAITEHFTVIQNKFDLYDAEIQPNSFILGGGSNVLITKPQYDVIYMKNRGIFIEKEKPKNVILRAEAGEIWDNFVKFCVEHDFYGAENLSLIPGTVGAAPIQNIGAYGAEVKDIIEAVEVFDIETKNYYIINNRKCDFGYRSSIFKTKLKSKVVVSCVFFNLSKVKKFNLQYGDLKNLHDKHDLTLEDVRNEVIRIRTTKLPDTKEYGNSGSFFKNAVVDKKKFNELLNKYPEMPHFNAEGGIKIPTAWLIDKSGMKGYREANVGVFPNQPLVIVNYGGATAEDILKLSDLVEQKVFENFGIRIEKEVNLIN